MIRRWQNTLLRNLIEAQAYWSSEANMLNEPLASFLKAWRARYAQMSGATTWLAGHLPVIDKKGIDVGLYDDFIEINTRFKKGGPIGLKEIGYLKLTHPKHPDAILLLGLFCYKAQESERRAVLDKMSPLRFEALGSELLQHCYNAGKRSDAMAVAKSAVEILHRRRQSPDNKSGSRFHRAG